MSDYEIRDSRVRAARNNDLESEYAFDAVLGRGAFGEVWKVRNRQTGKTRALKLIDLESIIEPGMTENEKTTKLDGLLREITIMKKISKTSCQKNMVCLFDAVQGKRDGHNYIALEMQLIDSPDLWKNTKARRDERPERNFTTAEVQKMFADLLEALAYMHRRGIVHRDIKAENVFWDEAQGQAILGDFGLSCMYELNCKGWAGTLSYNHPDVLQQLGCRGDGHNFQLEIRGNTGNILWKKNDIYGVGLLMREALNLDTASASCKNNTLFVEVPGIPTNLPDNLRRALELSQSADIRNIPSAEELLNILRGRSQSQRKK